MNSDYPSQDLLIAIRDACLAIAKHTDDGGLEDMGNLIDNYICNGGRAIIQFPALR